MFENFDASGPIGMRLAHPNIRSLEYHLHVVNHPLYRLRRAARFIKAVRAAETRQPAVV